jgi:hypothetical protein
MSIKGGCKMIVIQTYKRNLKTGNAEYKNYYATSGLKAEMAIIRNDRENNDLTKYAPIVIYNVFDTEE